MDMVNVDHEVAHPTFTPQRLQYLYQATFIPCNDWFL